VQALHYKELEYLSSPLTAAESLIHICNQLRLPDAAQGILSHTMKVVPGAEQKIGANWYEKLRMYDTALGLYRKQLQV
jgi:serine/threonine-protein kinase mTOR